MGNFAAFLDASVLYPAPLRDLLMELAVSDLCRAKWSAAVHDEWIRAVLQNRSDLTHAQLERTRNLMNAHVRDALVTDFAQLIDVLELPDPDDRHVLAAAIKGRADLIVTVNLKDFPAEKLDRWGIEAQHPDEFLTHQFHLSQPSRQSRRLSPSISSSERRMSHHSYSAGTAMHEVQLKDAQAARGKRSLITRHGKPEAVVRGFADWQRLSNVPSFAVLTN